MSKIQHYLNHCIYKPIILSASLQKTKLAKHKYDWEFTEKSSPSKPLLHFPPAPSYTPT